MEWNKQPIRLSSAEYRQRSIKLIRCDLQETDVPCRFERRRIVRRLPEPQTISSGEEKSLY